MALLLEIDTGTAIVRIHSGERTEEERNAVIKKAAERYLRAVYPQLERLGLLDQLTRSVSTEDGQANGQPMGQPDGHQEHNSLDNSGTTLWTQHKKIKESKENKESKEDKKGDSSDGKHPDHSPSVPYETIQNLYNEICQSLPRCKVMSEARKKAIKARLSSGYTLEHFKTVFTKAEASSFLKGKNGRNWKADFDWILMDSKMARVLEGYYDDAKGSRQPVKQLEHNFPSGGNVFLDILKGGEYV